MSLLQLNPRWRRIRFVVLLAAVIGYSADVAFNQGVPWFLFRMLAVGLTALVIFEYFAGWPKIIPLNFPRWALQVVTVACAVPLATLIIWSLTTPFGEWPFWKDGDRLMEFGFVTTLGLLIVPWIALGTLVRQKEAFAHEQQIALRLTRSELERNEQQARLRLIQAQVEPHFLFNTLANVQALVDAGSPNAPALLRALTTYLRTAMTRLNQGKPTLDQELTSVRAYLELMQMRMPDRLTFTVSADVGTAQLHCPPMMVMTLVENAVKHGIDPAESGGRIDVHASLLDTRCRIQVTDTGIGIQTEVGENSTGLSTLRERLKLDFGAQASLRLHSIEPTGVCAEIEMPAEMVKL